jgi:hypothetical protein
MAILVSTILIVTGAILLWGVEGTVAGIEVGTLGVILVAGGGVGFVASVLLSARPVSARGGRSVPGRDSVMATAEDEWPEAEVQHAEARDAQRPPTR